MQREISHRRSKNDQSPACAQDTITCRCERNFCKSVILDVLRVNKTLLSVHLQQIVCYYVGLIADLGQIEFTLLHTRVEEVLQGDNPLHFAGGFLAQYNQVFQWRTAAHWVHISEASQVYAVWL